MVVDMYERLENCDVGDGEAAMTAAEAMESLVLHRECLTAMCERKMAAGRIVRVEAEKTVAAKVIRFPVRDRHRAPYRAPATLAEAKSGLDRHRACADECAAKRSYEDAVKAMVRGRHPGWNIWRITEQ